MSRAKIAALVGCIWYSLMVLIGLLAVGVVWLFPSHTVQQLLQEQALTVGELRMALTIAYSVLFILMILNWLAFAKLTRHNAWRIYLLVVGLFYLFASMINGIGLFLTLPVAVCFILSFALGRKEKA